MPLKSGQALARILILAVILAALPVAVHGYSLPAAHVTSSAFPPLDGHPPYPSPTDRLGFGVAKGIDSAPPEMLETLKAGWYVNWGSSPNAPHPAGMVYVQIIRLTQNGYSPNGEALKAAIRRNPGTLWLIGNEPDSPYQDNQTPEQYIEKYHELYYLIKSIDPTALVAIGGVIQATPLRLRYLDMIWDGYRQRYGEEMPVDVWNVHNFILRESGPDCPAGGVWGAFIPPGISDPCGKLYTLNDHDNMDIFREQIRAFRAWMKEKGQQNKPLIVSEYGILFPEELGFDAERVRKFMLATFDFFMDAQDPSLGYPQDDYRLVQQWAWFSLDVTSFEWGTTHSALYDPEQQDLTPLGQAFANYAASRHVSYYDLRPTTPMLSSSTPVPFGGEATVQVDIPVINEGNTVGAGTLSLSRAEGDGWSTVGTGSIAQVPRRFSGSYVVRFQDTVSLRAPLRYRVVVNASNDARPSNNVLVATLSWDVALAWARAEGAGYAPDGQPGRVRARVAVTNATTLPLANVPVRLVDASDPAHLLAEGVIPEVAPHSTGEIVLAWQMPAGTHRVRAVVDPDNVVDEVDEGNNSVEFEVQVFPHRWLLPVVPYRWQR